MFINLLLFFTYNINRINMIINGINIILLRFLAFLRWLPFLKELVLQDLDCLFHCFAFDCSPLFW